MSIQINPALITLAISHIEQCVMGANEVVIMPVQDIINAAQQSIGRPEVACLSYSDQHLIVALDAMIYAASSGWSRTGYQLSRPNLVEALGAFASAVISGHDRSFTNAQVAAPQQTLQHHPYAQQPYQHQPKQPAPQTYQPPQLQQHQSANTQHTQVPQIKTHHNTQPVQQSTGSKIMTKSRDPRSTTISLNRAANENHNPQPVQPQQVPEQPQQQKMVRPTETGTQSEYISKTNKTGVTMSLKPVQAPAQNQDRQAEHQDRQAEQQVRQAEQQARQAEQQARQAEQYVNATAEVTHPDLLPEQQQFLEKEVAANPDTLFVTHELRAYVVEQEEGNPVYYNGYLKHIGIERRDGELKETSYLIHRSWLDNSTSVPKLIKGKAPLTMKEVHEVLGYESFDEVSTECEQLDINLTNASALLASAKLIDEGTQVLEGDVTECLVTLTNTNDLPETKDMEILREFTSVVSGEINADAFVSKLESMESRLTSNIYKAIGYQVVMLVSQIAKGLGVKDITMNNMSDVGKVVEAMPTTAVEQLNAALENVLDYNEETGAINIKRVTEALVTNKTLGELYHGELPNELINITGDGSGLLHLADTMRMVMDNKLVVEAVIYTADNKLVNIHWINKPNGKVLTYFSL